MPSQNFEGIRRNSTVPAVKIHRNGTKYAVAVGLRICRSDVPTHCTPVGAGQTLT